MDEGSDVLKSAAGLMLALADDIAPSFPQHAVAIKQEVIGQRMTDERWRRVRAVLASLLPIPGVYLRQEDRDRRLRAFSGMQVADLASRVKSGLHRFREAESMLSGLIPGLMEEIRKNEVHPEPVT